MALLNWWVARVNIVIAHETSNITCLLMSESTRYLALKSNPAFMQGSALKFVGRSGGHMNLQVIIQVTHIGSIFTELKFFEHLQKLYLMNLHNSIISEQFDETISQPEPTLRFGDRPKTHSSRFWFPGCYRHRSQQTSRTEYYR